MMEAAIRWSPHSSAGDRRFILLDILNSSISLHQLLSVNNSTVESKELASSSKLPSFAAFDWSKTSSQIISLGHVSGSASLVRLKTEAQTFEIVATYKARQQRRCNSTALSTQDWLAVALDKTRSDLCLNMYDAASGNLEPVRKLCPAELMSSVRFFASQPQELLAGAQRAFVRLYDLRDGFAGGPGNLQVASKNVNNIAIDPLDENYFATGGSTDDPSVTVWDKRWLSNSAAGPESGAAFDFRPAMNNTSRTSVWSMRFSGLRRGRLALSSSTGELKVIDMVADLVSDPFKIEHQPPNLLGGTPWTNRRYVKETRILEPPTTDQHRGIPATERVVAFDWISASESDSEQNMIVLRQNRDIGAFKLSSRTAAGLSSLGTLGVAHQDLKMVDPGAECSIRSRLADVQLDPLINNVGTSHAEDQTIGFTQVVTIGNPLVQDTLNVTTVQQQRCRAGYLFDCQKNAAITSSSQQLRRLWESIERLKTLAAHDGMVFDSADFSYVGIHGLWFSTAGNSPQKGLLISSTKPAEAIVGLNEKLEIPLFEGERTDYAEHRQLCLAVCGWKFKSEDLELECNGLIERGLYYQAIVQAVLHGAKHVALNMLRTLIRSKTIQNIGLGALLAATELNDEQREMTQWMAADSDDPALKALLTYLNSGDWRDVMKTTYLHLGYRLALGLRYLNDTELSGFIQSETARAIKKGDVEGVLLTGLTDQAMDLFQTYITRTNDLQTAVLATAHTNPLYVDDHRWTMWKETYFMQMQAWRAFPERARFTAEHNRLARSREDRSLVEPTAPLPKLRCVHCHNDISRRSRHDQRQEEYRTKPPSPADNAGVVCVKCGRHLPRCSICTLWLGASDPQKAKPLPGQRKYNGNKGLTEQMLVFCTKCEHGSHAHHAQEWFNQYNICPVPGCACKCNNGSAKQGLSMAQLWQAQ